MAYPRVYHLAIGAALAAGSLNATVFAQFSNSPPAADNAAAEDDTPTTKGAGARDTAKAADPNGANPRAPWDNPEMRLRMLKASFTGMGGMGGPGGMRGGRGGPGGGAPERPSAVSVMIGLLQRSPALQEEIKLTEDQKEKIKTINDMANEKRREFFANRQQNGGGQNGGGQNGGGRGNRGGGGNFDFQAMREQMNAMNQESEVAILKILTKPQKTRLSQIALQIEGPLAVSRPEIASSLKLNEMQIEKIQAVLAQMQAAQQEVMMAQMTQMRGLFGGGRGGPGGPGGGGPGGRPGGAPGAGPGGAPGGGPGGGAVAADAADDGGPATKNANNNRGGRNRPQMTPEAQEAMQTAMKTAGEESDKVLAKAESAINKLLTASQKKKIKTMLGPEFDVTTLANENTGRGGPGGGFGGPGGGFGGPGGRPGGQPGQGGQGGNRGGRNAPQAAIQ